MRLPPWDRSKGRPEPIAALNRVLELENGEPLVDLREACPRVRILRPQVIPWARERVAAMLDQASRSLPEGRALGLIEAWRPVSRQQRIYDFWYAAAREAFPERSHASIRRTICRLVAPTDQKAPPGHCTGAAIDVWLIDDAGEAIDVVAPYSWIEATRTYVLGLTPEAQENRDLLVNAMLDAGFSNCRDEWWHYSWGDAGWAVREALDACCYGLIGLPPSEYEEQERLSAEAMATRENPFLRAD